MLAVVPEVEDEEGQGQQQVEGTDGVVGPYEQIAEKTEDASDQADHRPVEDREPHVAAGLVGVDVNEQQLVLVHQVHHAEVDHAQGDDQRRDLQSYHISESSVRLHSNQSYPST